MTDTFLDVLNANCGDILKAHILNSRYGFDINLVSVRAPVGDVEAAFAVERARKAEAEKPRAADTILADIKKDHAKLPPAAVVETLPRMPETLRYEDGVEAPKAPETSIGVADGEYVVDGQVYVTALRAAELRDNPDLKSVRNAAFNRKWPRVRHPQDGRTMLYLKAAVVAGRKAV